MFIIKWKTPGSLRVVTGCVQYMSKEQAEAQVAKWQQHFDNTYEVQREQE